MNLSPSKQSATTNKFRPADRAAAKPPNLIIIEINLIINNKMKENIMKLIKRILNAIAYPFIAFSVIAEETRNANLEAEAYKRMKRKERRCRR